MQPCVVDLRRVSRSGWQSPADASCRPHSWSHSIRRAPVQIGGAQQPVFGVLLDGDVVMTRRRGRPVQPGYAPTAGCGRSAASPARAVGPSVAPRTRRHSHPARSVEDCPSITTRTSEPPDQAIKRLRASRALRRRIHSVSTSLGCFATVVERRCFTDARWSRQMRRILQSKP